MAIHKSKLAAALKKRFGSPAAVLRHLGLDDLAAPAPGGGDGDDRLRAMRIAVEKCLEETKNMPAEQAVAKMLRVLDEHVKLDELADSDPQAGAIRELSGTDQDDRFEEFRALLRDAGLAEALIEKAIELSGSGGGGAKDRLPLDGTRGGFGGHGHGSEADRVGRTAMDEATKFLGEGFARITVGPDHRQPRRPVHAPSEAKVAEFNAMFPMAARLE